MPLSEHNCSRVLLLIRADLDDGDQRRYPRSEDINGYQLVGLWNTP